RKKGTWEGLTTYPKPPYFNEAHLGAFGVTYFSYLQGVDELAFSEQLVHELSLRRVENQGVKDLEGLTYLIGCELTRFTMQDFCLITGQRDIKKEKGKGKTKAIPKKVSKKISVTCDELEREFKECKNRGNAFKLGLVYFVDDVLIGPKNNVDTTSTLWRIMDRFNRFVWGSISFEQLHDNLSFTASRRGRGRVEGDGEGDEEEEEEEEEVRETKRA
ncbi:hypothetical protein DVH24_004963, partial [Malus domestica]